MTAAVAPTPAPPRQGTPSVPGVLLLWGPISRGASEEVSGDALPGIALRRARRLRDRVNLRVKVGDRWLPLTWLEMHRACVATTAALVKRGSRPATAPSEIDGRQAG